MKRLKFKKPFNGMDNAKKLIPESYKVDGNEFEITDGNETYRVKWSSLINEGIVLTSSNKARINEDMSKIKHLMGFKSQETLGTVKGVERLNENKKFGNILNKTKRLLNENLDNPDYYKELEFERNRERAELKNTINHEGITIHILPNGQFKIVDKNFDKSRVFNDLDSAQQHAEYMAFGEYDSDMMDNRHFDSDSGQGWGDPTMYEGMGGSNKGKSRTDKTEVLKKKSKKGRREADKEATKDTNEKELTPAQKSEIDVNNDGKIDAKDFKALRHIKEEDLGTSDTNNSEEGAGEDTLSKTEIAKTLKKFASTINQASFDLKERDLVTKLLKVIIKLAEKDKSVDAGVKKKFEIFIKELGIINESKNLREQEETYDFSNTTDPDFVGHVEEYVLVGPSGEVIKNLGKMNGEQADLLVPEELREKGYIATPESVVPDPYDNAEDLNYGVYEANAIKPGAVRSGMGGDRGLANSHLTKGESKNKSRNHALRQAGKNEIAYQLANMKPDEEALRHAAYDDEESDIARELYTGALTIPPSEEEQAAQIYEDRFDEVFGGIYEEEDLNEVVSFEDTKYAEEFDDYDDSFYAAKKAWEVKRIPKVKAKVIKMANELNNMISIKDGYGDDVVIKWYDSNAIFNEVEFDENQMTVSYRDYYDRKSDVETYDLNDYSVYEDGLYDDNLMQVLKKAIKGYKKKTSNIQNKTNFYPYYTVDMDDKRILDAFETKEDAIYSKKDLSEPSVKIINIKGLERLNLKPINIGS